MNHRVIIPLRLFVILTAASFLPLSISAQTPAPAPASANVAELTLADAIELFHKHHPAISAARLSVERARTGKGEASGNETKLAEAELAEVVRIGLRELKQAFYEAVLAQYFSGDTRGNLQYLDELIETAQARAEVGAEPESAARKIKQERAQLADTLATAQLQAQQATLRLLQAIGLSNYARLPEVTGNLNSQPIQLDYQSLIVTALRERPDLRAAELKKASTTELTALRNRICAEVEAAFAAYETYREQTATMQVNQLTRAADAHATAHTGYFEKVAPLLPLIEATRARQEVRAAHFRALFRLQLSLLELEAAIGKQFQP